MVLIEMNYHGDRLAFSTDRLKHNRLECSYLYHFLKPTCLWWRRLAKNLSANVLLERVSAIFLCGTPKVVCLYNFNKQDHHLIVIHAERKPTVLSFSFLSVFLAANIVLNTV
jgi:hypothetical protein